METKEKDVEYYPDNFSELIEPGKSVRIFYNKNSINNELRHIRAIVDDSQVVYRVWSKRWQDWRYCTVHIEDLFYLFKNGVLKEK
jgi:hypothetical protein